MKPANQAYLTEDFLCMNTQKAARYLNKTMDIFLLGLCKAGSFPKIDARANHL